MAIVAGLAGASMSGTAVDTVMPCVRGAADAERLLFTIGQGCAPADLLLEGIEQAQALGDRAYVQAFVREVQKRLERAGGGDR